MITKEQAAAVADDIAAESHGNALSSMIKGKVFSVGAAFIAQSETAYKIASAIRALPDTQDPKIAALTADRDMLVEAVHNEIKVEKSGFWNSCSGCHESSEGVPQGPFSKLFQCHQGFGCSECGGIGAVWDNLDYSALAAKEPTQ